MINFANQTPRQNQLLNVMREGVRQYVQTLDDITKQANIIIGFENFLNESVRTGPMDITCLMDKTQCEFDGICFGAGFVKDSVGNEIWKQNSMMENLP